MIDHDGDKKQMSGKGANEVDLANKILSFIRYASAKTSSNPYFTQTEIISLKYFGENLGLPQGVIDEVIRSNSANNAKLLKEISLARGDLRTLKTEFVHTIQILQNSTKGEGAALHIGGNEKTNDQNSQDIKVNIDTQYQTSIAGLQNHLNELKVTSGGEGEVNRAKNVTKETEKHQKINTDNTTITALQLTKQFQYEG